MCIGQLVKLKQRAEIQFSDPVQGSVTYVNEWENCYCILLDFCNHNQTYEIILDGDIGFNVYPENLEAM